MTPSKDPAVSRVEPSDDTVPVNRYASAPAWRAVDAFFTDALLDEDAALVAARESSTRTTLPHAEVAANQGAFLAMLARIGGARRVLEFGTLAGYSTIWLARAVGADGRVVTLELEEQNAAVARENLERAGVGDRVEVVVGPAATSAAALVEDGVAPFDLVFIDADKQSNTIYLDWAARLGRSGTVVVVDNVGRAGEIVDENTDDPMVIGTRNALRMLGEDPRFDATALQTVGAKGWDGFALAVVV